MRENNKLLTFNEKNVENGNADFSENEKNMKSFFSSRRCQVTGLNGVTFLDRTRMVADPPGSPPQAPAYQVVQGCIFSWKIIPLEKNFFPSSSVNIFEEINRGNKYFFLWETNICVISIKKDKQTFKSNFLFFSEIFKSFQDPTPSGISTPASRF